MQDLLKEELIRIKTRIEETAEDLQKEIKDLMSKDEISVMDGSKCILQLRGVRPRMSMRSLVYEAAYSRLVHKMFRFYSLEHRAVK